MPPAPHSDRRLPDFQRHTGGFASVSDREPPEQILVGMEFAGHHGHTFAAFLKELGYVVVAVLPMVTKRHKEDQDNSPLKNDQKDAGLVCKLAGEGKFVGFAQLDVPFGEMRSLATQRHRLSVEGVRYRNRLQGLLDVAWPEFAGAFATIAAPTPLAILRRWPLPADLAAASPQAVHALIAKTSRGNYGPEKARALREEAKRSVGLGNAAEARRREIWDVMDRWELLRAQMKATDDRIEQVVMNYAPARALTTIPELGPVGAATILSEMGALHDFVHARQVLKLAGMNLVGSSSAGKDGRRWQSKRGRPLLRKHLFLLATRWCKKSGLFRVQYEAMVKRNGGSKIKALAALARKLAPLILEIAQAENSFDHERWAKERRLRSA